MNRANFKFLSKWDSHFEIAICYQPSTNRQLGRKTRRVRFIFHPLLSASIRESIAVIQRASFAIEYISARIAFPPPPPFVISHVSKFLPLATLLRHQIRCKYSPIRDACRMAENIVKGYYSNTCFFFFFFVKCATLFRVKFYLLIYCIATIISFEAFNRTIF